MHATHDVGSSIGEEVSWRQEQSCPPQVAKIARPEAFALEHPEALPRPCRDARPGRAAAARWGRVKRGEPEVAQARSGGGVAHDLGSSLLQTATVGNEGHGQGGTGIQRHNTSSHCLWLQLQCHAVLVAHAPEGFSTQLEQR